LPEVISIATAGEGSTTYIAGTAFSKVVTKYTPMKAIIEPAGASGKWLPLMKTGEIDFGMHCSFLDQSDAHYGKFAWKDRGPQSNLFAFTGHIMPFSFYSLDPKIRTFDDMRGKRLYGDQTPMRIMSGVLEKLMEAAGMKEGDIKVLKFANIREQTAGMAEGKADVGWYVVTAGPVVELGRTKGLTAVEVPQKYIDYVMENLPGAILSTTWKKGVSVADRDVTAMALPCGTSARADLDPEVVYTYMKTIYSHYDEYKDVHAMLGQWTPQRGVQGFPIPMHPGAIKYFKEMGLWTQKEEALNQKLIAMEKK
jgi:TRAP transporter TAXI family solute receptor